jgi:predicted nucleic acid-binding protein
MYVDTSVLVKLYLREPDSEECEAIVAGTGVVSSRLAYCEFKSSILGKIQRGGLPTESGAVVWQRFEKDIANQEVCLVSLDDLIVQDATDLLSELHPVVHLRMMDALHLATFMGIEAGPLYTKDRRMLQAATKLGLPLAG